MKDTSDCYFQKGEQHRVMHNPDEALNDPRLA
jgi:hypothetical protein